jgi:hypothetical protein
MIDEGAYCRRIAERGQWHVRGSLEMRRLKTLRVRWERMSNKNYVNRNLHRISMACDQMRPGRMAYKRMIRTTIDQV